MVLMYWSGNLFEVAVTGYHRTVKARDTRAASRDWPGARSDRAPAPGDGAIVALVFAAMSLEAFINESAHAALMTLDQTGQGDQAVERFGLVVSAVETAHGSVQAKYDWAHRALRGKPYNKGEPPYQDFETLAVLRNSLFHFKVHGYRASGNPNEVDAHTFFYPEILKRLEGKHVLMDPRLEADEDELREPSEWTTPFWSAISTVAVARWACNTAAATVADLVAAMPEGPFKQMVPSPSFKPLD
jgi:hypothetical protein